jgi:hypothetical protein
MDIVYIPLLPPLLSSGVLSQTANTTVTVWSAILPQLQSLAVRLEVPVQVVSTNLETNTHLEGQYGLWGSFKEEVQGSW